MHGTNDWLAFCVWIEYCCRSFFLLFSKCILALICLLFILFVPSMFFLLLLSFSWFACTSFSHSCGWDLFKVFGPCFFFVYRSSSHVVCVCVYTFACCWWSFDFNGSVSRLCWSELSHASYKLNVPNQSPQNFHQQLEKRICCKLIHV